MRAVDGFLAKYNPYEWSKFLVDPKNMPKGPHFAAVLFETETRYSPGYDERDTGSSYSAIVTQYFAFPDKKTLESWLLRVTKEGKQFFFFEVKKLGEVELKVSVETDT